MTRAQDAIWFFALGGCTGLVAGVSMVLFVWAIFG